MAKDSILTGAVNDSSFKNGGLSATNAAVKNGERGPRLANRTSSPRAQDEITKITSPKVQKPTRG